MLDFPYLLHTIGPAAALNMASKQALRLCGPEDGKTFEVSENLKG